MRRLFKNGSFLIGVAFVITALVLVFASLWQNGGTDLPPDGSQSETGSSRSETDGSRSETLPSQGAPDGTGDNGGDVGGVGGVGGDNGSGVGGDIGGDVGGAPGATMAPAAKPTQAPLITINIPHLLDAGDLNKGPLILVSNKHAYEQPEESDIVEIAGRISTSTHLVYSSARLSETALGPLNEMMDAFYEQTGRHDVGIRSAHRSVEEQQWLYDDYFNRVAAELVPLYVSLPGHSEHHTGLAVDFGFGTEAGGDIRGFQGTGVHSWFSENCYNFGFVLRYPEDKTDVTGTNYEPWHYRYVGIPHAYVMHSNNWALEEYIELLRDFSVDNPFEVTFDGVAYEIFFAQAGVLSLPFGTEFEVSGNNVDGFIVTVKKIS